VASGTGVVLFPFEFRSSDNWGVTILYPIAPLSKVKAFTNDSTCNLRKKIEKSGIRLT
jgi:hypothetical protein